MKQDHLPDSAPAVPDAVKDLAAALGAGLSIWGAVIFSFWGQIGETNSH